jgi:hypothetical protein
VGGVRGRLDALSGADGDEATELSPRSTALSRLGASAHAYFIEPLPGGPSRACPPSRDPSPQGQRIPRRRAQRWTGPLPPRVTSPPNNLEVFTPKNPPTARPPKISAPRENLLRPSRPPATSSAGQPLPLERASSGSSESAHAAQTLNGKDAGQTGRVRARRRSRRRPYSPWLISREVRNLAGILCSRPLGRLFRD